MRVVKRAGRSTRRVLLGVGLWPT